MSRFLANMINPVDKKRRVSVPASFRAALGDQNVLYIMLSISSPTIEAGGPKLIDMAEARLAQMDPFSEEYEVWSFYIHGDSDQLKIDGDGRITLSDTICEHAEITDKVAFVGRGYFFQMWEPKRFKTYQQAARSKASALRACLGKSGHVNSLTEETLTNGREH